MTGRTSVPRRGWLPRVALALLVPLLLFGALEAGLRLAGYGTPANFLIPDQRPGYLRSNPDFARLFLPGNFDLRPLNFRMAARKAPGTVRIVILGESAAQGVPVPSFGFAPQIRAQLRAHYPGREFEVINTGIVAINSHVVYQVAREFAGYEPDLFVVYMGNNEVVGPYGPGCAYLSQMPPLWVIRASVFVRSTRTGQLLGALLARLSAHAGSRPAEWGGMSMFVDQAVAGDDPRLDQVYANFASNLRGIVAAAGGAGAKAILCTPVANLKDCAPFLSRHRAGLAGAELAAWQSGFDAGRLSWLLGEDENARVKLEGALARDPQYAETEFMLGRLDLEAGDVAAARSHLVAALHWDALRFRPDARIGEIVRTVAREHPGTAVLLDTARELGSDPASPGPPSGRELLFEHVHFDWEGSYRLGRLAAEACAAALGESPKPAAGWLGASESAAAVAYTLHERLPMLLRIDVLERKPPFTNQLTHPGDEAAMARDIARAERLGRTPETLREAAATAADALAGDPDNPALDGILEGIRLDEGKLEEALALARLAQARLPRDFALAADEASIQMRLGRFPEAEATLKAGARSGADLDLLAPVWADFWTRTKRFGEGRQFLDAVISRRPHDLRLRIIRAGLRRAAGDASGAEEEFRAILAADPASEDALEGLIALLAETGRPAQVGPLSLAAAPGQPRNQANSLRAAQECDAHGDADGALRNLQAAESSGPVTSTFELTLALKYYQERRFPDLLLHLAQARRLSLAEGNPPVTASIDGLVRRMRAEAAAAR